MISSPVSPASDCRLPNVADSLRKRGFAVHRAENAHDVLPIIMDRIIPLLNARTVAFGGSLSLTQAVPGLPAALRERGLIWPTEEADRPWPEVYEQRRAALLSDLYFSGTNAITAHGQLVNLDAVGNRVGALTFGPRNIIIVAGRNKVVPDLPAAFQRLREIAPKNAARLGFNTPCAATGRCIDCASPSRICNLWSIIERVDPPGRIHVILVDEDLGL